jgi:hypothetical protein
VLQRQYPSAPSPAEIYITIAAIFKPVLPKISAQKAEFNARSIHESRVGVTDRVFETS